MCGPSEYAQPPYFYLPSVGVVTTDVLGIGKASAQSSSTDSTDDNDDDIYIYTHIYVCMCLVFLYICIFKYVTGWLSYKNFKLNSSRSFLPAPIIRKKKQSKRKRKQFMNIVLFIQVGPT